MSGTTKEQQLSTQYYYIHNRHKSPWLYPYISLFSMLVLHLSAALLLISISPAPVTSSFPLKPQVHMSSL